MLSFLLRPSKQIIPLIQSTNIEYNRNRMAAWRRLKKKKKKKKKEKKKKKKKEKRTESEKRGNFCDD